MKIARVVGFALIAGAVCGCNGKLKPTPENFTSTLNAYFPDHRDCLLDGSVSFPLETGDAAQTKQMDALAAAQILEAHRAPAIHMTRYTLTDIGTKAGKNLCYGHRFVTSIDHWTPVALAHGFQETQVDYHYKVEDMPVWAKTPELMAAYPKMAAEATGNATGTVTMALTGVGWSVPD